MGNWTELDGSGKNREFIDYTIHHVYYFRQYTSRAGYGKSDTNNLIYNFKKGISVPNNQQYYKNIAIDTFIKELELLFSMIKNEKYFYVTWAPSSKAKNDPLYDDKMERVVKTACTKFSNFRPIELFETPTTRASWHSCSLPRSPDAVKKTVRYKNIDLNEKAGVFIIDDVLTTGATYNCLYSMIKKHHPNISIYGAVWAIAIEDYDTFFEIDSIN